MLVQPLPLTGHICPGAVLSPLVTQTPHPCKEAGGTKQSHVRVSALRGRLARDLIRGEGVGKAGRARRPGPAFPLGGNAASSAAAAAAEAPRHSSWRSAWVGAGGGPAPLRLLTGLNNQTIARLGFQPRHT